MEKEDQTNAHFSSSVLFISEVGAVSIINAARWQALGHVTLRAELTHLMSGAGRAGRWLSIDGRERRCRLATVATMA